jgi:hypothetical protein
MAKRKVRDVAVKQRNQQVHQYDKILREITERSEGYEREGAWRSSSGEVLSKATEESGFLKS